MSSAVLIFLAGLAGAVGRGILSSFIGMELRAVMNERFRRRVERAGGHLPDTLRPEMIEEWLAELQSLSERPLKAWRFVRSLPAAAYFLSLGLDATSKLPWRKRLSLSTFVFLPALVPAARRGDMPNVTRWSFLAYAVFVSLGMFELLNSIAVVAVSEFARAAFAVIVAAFFAIGLVACDRALVSPRVGQVSAGPIAGSVKGR